MLAFLREPPERLPLFIHAALGQQSFGLHVPQDLLQLGKVQGLVQSQVEGIWHDLTGVVVAVCEAWW
jgi:hypothetical protein